MKPLQWIKDNLILVFSLMTLIIGGGGFTVVGGINMIKRAIHAPERVDKNEENIRKLLDYQEKDWQFGRLITEDTDSLDWVYANDDGAVFDVDIRNIDGLVELAFIKQTKMVYPIYIDHASTNKKKYIIVHEKGINQNFTLYKKK